jgi:hypothetical protein
MISSALSATPRGSSPYLRRLVASREEVLLSPYMPHSWWHPEGRRSMVKRLEKKGFPSLWGWLFVTLTIDHDMFACEREAYERGVDRVRRVVNRLREMGYPIFRYFSKFELHADGWPHWHVGFDCPDFIHNDEVYEAWGLGFTKTLRVKKSRDFRYLFKYVVKDNGEIPDWVLDFGKRIRVFQTSVGFYGEPAKAVTSPKTECVEPVTLRSKFVDWSTKGTVRVRETNYQATPVRMTCTYPEVFIRCVESGARALDAYHLSLSIESIVEYILPWKPKQNRNPPPQNPCRRLQALAHFPMEAI